MNKKLLIMGMVALACSGRSWGSGPGTTAADVLNIGVGARAIGMGEAFTAGADDVSSLYWNPAGLGLLNQSEASFMYDQAYNDMNYSNANIGLSLENGGIGGQLSYLGYGKIAGLDASGNPTGNVDAYSGVATLGGGYILDPFTVGVNLKGIRESLADVSATGEAVDLGTTFVYPDTVFGGSTLRVAATLRNLGPGMKLLNQTDPLPTEWRLGTSLLQLAHEKLNLGLDVGKMRGEDTAVYLGGEYWVHRFVALRAGYADNHAEGDGVRLGIGFKVGDVSFDYAYADFGDLGMTNRFELGYRFGEIRPRLTPEERKLFKRAKLAMRQQQYGEAVLILDSLMKMEPKYRPFYRTYKVALSGNQQQERMAKGMNTFISGGASGSKASGGTLSDLDDLEALLSVNTNDESVALKKAK